MPKRRPKTFLEIAEGASDFRWPKKGDRLLRASNDWNKAVEFTEAPVERHVHIWTGYMRAGAALIDASEQEATDRHFLIYPILFNYRHGIELAMKWVIGQYGHYADVRLGADELDHDLWKLWKACRKVIVELGSSGEADEALQAVQQVIKDIHDLDKGAMAFRYSTNKGGIAIRLPSHPIDLQHLRDVMEAVDNFFSGVDGELDANVSASDWDVG